MSNNFGYIDIILLAMIAGFIILRLRNILGRKTGHEDKTFGNFSEKKFEHFKKEETKSEKIKDTGFEGKQKEEFLKGAEIAYETIITSFAKGENEKLRSLLTGKMVTTFSEAIKERNKNNIKSELTFIGIKESQLKKFEKIKNEFSATVKFVSEIISVKRNKENEIIEGDHNKIKIVTDHWKFSKNIFSKNPTWYLSEIISK